MEISDEIIRNISDWIWETDEFGNFTFYTKHTKIFHGLSFKQFLDRNLFEIIPRKYLTHQEPIVNFKTKFTDINGFLVYYNINAIPYYDKDNNFKGYKGITKLINIIKEEKTQVIKNPEILTLIYENMKDLILVINLKLKIYYINPQSFQRSLGYSEIDFNNKKFLKFCHPDEKRKIKDFFKNLRSKMEEIIEIRLKHENGSWLWFEVIGKMFKDKSANSRYLLISRDITERKINEKKK